MGSEVRAVGYGTGEGPRHIAGVIEDDVRGHGG